METKWLFTLNHQKSSMKLLIHISTNRTLLYYIRISSFHDCKDFKNQVILVKLIADC